MIITLTNLNSAQHQFEERVLQKIESGPGSLTDKINAAKDEIEGK